MESTLIGNRTLRYFIAVTFILIAAVISFVARPLLGPGVMTLFGMAVLACSFYFGLAAGLSVATAAVLISDYWFMPPLYSFGSYRVADSAYVVLLFVIAFLGNKERVSQQKMHQALDARANELDRVATLVG